MNLKKLVSAALTATTVLWMVGAAVLPVAANAQSTSSIQTQIAALLAEINQLQAQLGTSSQTTTTTSASNYQFNNDLTVGSTGADVDALQALLIAKGYLTAVSAPTGYFGVLTQAAVAKFQAANGITPTAGYFGPKTRAFVNSMNVSTTTTTTGSYPAGCTSSAGFSPTTGVSCSATTTTTTTTTTGTTGTNTSVTAPATGLLVTLASDNPSSAVNSLISSSNGGGSEARVPVLGVDFTAGDSGAVTLSQVQFNKIGVLSDSSINGAYLLQNGQVLAQYNSINNGVITFSGLNLQIPAGQTLDLQLAIDPASGLSAGNSVSFSLNAASQVTAWDVNNNAITPVGAFPFNGNTFTVTQVTNPELATLAITSSSIATTVTAGTQGNIVGGWNFTVNNNLVWLKGIAFHVIGSANVSNLQNVKLMVNGTQVGPTLASVPANGVAYFNAASAPGSLNTGSNNVQIFADVMGSPSDNFQFEVLNSYDVLAVDSQYNVPIAVTNTGGDGTEVFIQQGTITMSQDSSTPTGNVAVGQSGVTLAKFDIYAGGEAVKVKWLDFALAFTGVTGGATINSQIKNIALTDDAGGQVGTTINTPPSGNACADTSSNSDITNAENAGAATFTSAGSATYEDCFGTSASNINYIVPANTTRVLSLKGDIQSGATFSTVTASLLSDSGNLQGLTSSQTGSSSGAVGSALSLASTLLTVAQNNALATPVNVTPNSSHVKIGSYNFQASSASGVQVNTLSFLVGGSGVSSFQNLGVFVNGAQFGTTQGVVSPATTYSFSGTPFSIPAGGSVNVDVYADLLSSATGTITTATTLSGCSATGVTSYNAITCSSVAGQNVHLSGSAAITVTADGSQPSAGQIVMGSTGNTLAVYRFTETTNAENVKVTQLTIHDAVSSGAAQFSNLTLWNGSTEIGQVGAASAGTSLVGASNAVDATGTITIGGLTASATTTNGYQALVNINGVGGFISIPGNITSSTVATDLAAGITSASASFQASATASGNVVTVTSQLTSNTTMTISGTDNTPVTYAVNGLHGGAAANAGTVTTSGSTTNYIFQIQGNPIVVPQANSISITLKGDASPYTPGATDNQTNVFSVSAGTVTALGQSSNLPSTVTLSGATGNTQTLLRTILTPSINNSSQDGSYYTPSNHQSRNVTDDLAEVKFSANTSGGAILTHLTVTFSGSLASSSNFLGGVQLLDSNGISLVADGATTTLSSACTATTSCSVTWTIPTSTTQAQISAGGTGLFKLRINDQDGQAAVANTSMSLSASIQGAGDVNYYDSLDNSGNSITSIPTNLVPLSIASFALPLGN